MQTVMSLEAIVFKAIARSVEPMSARVRDAFTFRVGTAFGLAFLVLALFVLVVGWEEVLGAAARARLPVYALAFVASGWCLLARSYVWHRLLTVVDQRRPYWLVGGVFLTGMFAKYVIPYGQVTSGVGMAAVVSRYYESAYEESLASILSADFLNYVPYYSFGAIGIGYLIVSDAVPTRISESLPVAIAGVIALVLIVLTAWRFRETVARVSVSGLRGILARTAPSMADRITRETLHERFRGFSITIGLLSRNRTAMLVSAILAHAAWLGLAGALYFSALALGESLPIGIVFVCVALSKLGFVVPTPGGVGGVEIALASVLFLLTPMGTAVATAVAILYRFGTYWFTIALGGLSSIALTIADPTPP